jgi:hypothetical protein
MIGSRLSICTFHPRRGDPKIVTILPLYSRFQVMELASAGGSEMSSGPSAASIFDGVLIFLDYTTQSHNRPARRENLSPEQPCRSDIGISDPGYGTIRGPPFFRLRAVSEEKCDLEFRGTSNALLLSVSGKLIELTQNRDHELCRSNRQRMEELKKEDGTKMAKKKRVLLRAYLSEPLDELRNNHARHEIGMGIFWGVLALVCGGLGWVLLTILLKST